MRHSNSICAAGLVLLLLCTTATASASPLKINLSQADVERLGHKIWRNEGLGKVENLTVWNKGEDFPSFGIGHFIWYPSGAQGPFIETFPRLLQYLQQTTVLPSWLKKNQTAPWPNRRVFYEQIASREMLELRQLLANTLPQQTRFIIQRLQRTLPKMLESLNTASQRQHVKIQFSRMANTPNGLYALIDYVNFKGEGTSLKERYAGQGWGLLQVLQTMPINTSNVTQAFVKAANQVLTRRVANASRDESRWLLGWRKRLQTYR